MSRSPDAHRPYPLEINAVVDDDSLEISWTYAGALFAEERIQAWADAHMAALLRRVDHCLTTSDRGHTPSDFPDAGLAQAGSAEVMEGFGR